MAETAAPRAELTTLAARLGLRMENWALLDQALTHASATAPQSGADSNYEPLEFVGDAVLGLAVTHYLYEHVPGRTPGEYSRMRAGTVNRRTLAKIARELGLGEAIRLGKGEETSGGRNRSALLADCMEAVIGAVYLDQGWPHAQQFVEAIFEAELTRATRDDKLWDFKSRLQHYCQAQHIALPLFTVVRCEGPDHRREFEVEVSLRDLPSGRGRGLTKKEAEQNAARAALEQEGQLSS